MNFLPRLLPSLAALSLLAAPSLSQANDVALNEVQASSLESSNLSIVPSFGSGGWPGYNSGHYPGYGYNPGGYSSNYYPGYYPQHGWYQGPGFHGWPNSGHYSQPFNRWYPARSIVPFHQLLGSGYSYGQPVNCVGIYGRINPNLRPLDNYGYGYASVVLGGRPYGNPIYFNPHQNFYQFCLNSYGNNSGNYGHNNSYYPGTNAVTPVYGFGHSEFDQAQFEFHGDFFVDSVVYY